jgi:hypothetical protein
MGHVGKAADDAGTRGRYFAQMGKHALRIVRLLKEVCDDDDIKIRSKAPHLLDVQLL